MPETSTLIRLIGPFRPFACTSRENYRTFGPWVLA